MYKQLDLSNQICFPFYAISRRIIKAYIPYLKKIWLTYPQYLVMLVLWKKEQILIKEIGEQLLLETNTLSPILDNLLSSWFIKKEKKDTNKKEIYVSLTKEGRLLEEQAKNIPALLSKDFDLSESELNTLHAQLWWLLDKFK